MYAYTATKTIAGAMAKTVDRHNEDRAKRLHLYKLAQATIEAKEQWHSSETVKLLTGTLANGRRWEIWLKPYNGIISMQLFVDAPRLHNRYISGGYQCGMLHPGKGWYFTGDEDKFLDWSRQISRELERKSIL